jgi:MFS transporter, DHA2 family, multidrug resistance protein
MTGFTIEMGERSIIVSGVIQGLGLGLVFVPLSTLAFATLEARFRTDATSLFSLTRNLGSSVGISMVMTLLAQNTQVNHAVLAEHVTPFNPMLNGRLTDLADLSAIASLNAEVTRQAMMIAYLDDFKLMMFVALLAVPMLLLLRNPRRNPSPDSHAAAMD